MAKVREYRNGLMVINFETQKLPEFREVRNKDWVYLGKDNLYPDELIELYERSATHGAIVNGKVSYILGEGFTAGKGATLEMKTKVSEFIKKINPEDSLEELAGKNVLDLELYDGLYIEVIRNKAKTDFTLEYLPFNKMRTNVDMDKFWFSNDWKPMNQSEEKTGLKEFEAFDPDTYKTIGADSTVFYFKILKPRKGSDPNVYPLPTYIGGTQAIETEIECMNYGLSEIKSGFSAGNMLNMNNGVPKEEKQKEIKKKITDQLTGSDSAGKFILSFADSKDRSSEVIALSGNDLPDRYMNVKRDSMKSIFTSHRVSSPALFGVQQDNVSFGTAQEIAEQYELFQNTYISKRQQIVESIYNYFAAIKGLQAKLVIKPTKAITVDTFTEQTIVRMLPKAAVSEIIAERFGIDLSKFENTTVTETVETQMGKDVSAQQIIEAFQTIGRDKDKFDIISSKPFTFESEVKTLESELHHFIDLPEEESIGSRLLKILKIPTITKGQEKKEDENKIEILYSYELRKDAPRLIGESRDFCKNLIQLNRLYTRDEINGLRNDLRTNVWLYKGGWYTNPNTDAPTPQCRHIWKQNIVRLK